MENAVRGGAGAGGGKCHIARDEIALLGVLRRDGTGGSFRAGRALRNASLHSLASVQTQIKICSAKPLFSFSSFLK